MPALSNTDHERTDSPLLRSLSACYHDRSCISASQLRSDALHERAWHPSMASGTDHLSDEIPFPAPVTKKPRGTFDLTEPQADTPGADPHTPPHEYPRTSLHKCSQCPANFLTPSGIVSISINTLGDHYSRLLTSLEESGSDLVALSGIKILCT